MKKVAIVILNWNGEKFLRKFLPDLIQHTTESLADIIIADNGSTDTSVTFLQKEYPQLQIILLDKNYGFAEGYNRALSNLDYSFLLLLNSDVEVTKHWLEPLVDYLQQHPEAAACQPKVRAYYDKEKFEHAGACGGYIDKYGYPFCRGRIMRITEKDHGQYDDIVPIFWATGACLLIRATEYKDAGGLDDRFFAHMEEIDLCWRLRSRGKTIVCIPASTVYHVGGGTLQKGSPFKTYLNFRNNLLMLYKNLPEDELKPIMRIRWWLDTLAEVRFLLFADWKNFKAVVKARYDYRKMKKEMGTDRQSNLAHSVTSHIPERVEKSLLVAFYVRKIHSFSRFIR
ncbi:MAG: glycosyltransferase family 2 protein [Bacteroidales bacterium]|nr:glycosyltransferase family 2 protein [Bacteroidales bacterium]MDD4823396.1 glycosyltransferase family 2 protein [Bacteroidales bacterium]